MRSSASRARGRFAPPSRASRLRAPIFLLSECVPCRVCASQPTFVTCFVFVCNLVALCLSVLIPCSGCSHSHSFCYNFDTGFVAILQLLGCACYIYFLLCHIYIIYCVFIY